MKLWKDNRTDQEWELSNEEIARQFWACRGGVEAAPMHLESAIRGFVTGPQDFGGLSSVFDEPDFPALYDAVRAAWPDKPREVSK